MKSKISSEQITALRPSLRILRKIGLTEDQNGILRRYQREADAWSPHLSNTKKFIAECLVSCSPKKIAILGSGWFLDVPVEVLAQHEEVVFFDLRHPEFVRKKYKDYKNFHFGTLDLTGGLITKTFELCRHRRNLDPENIFRNLQGPGMMLPGSFDYIVSVNLLNQLDILIIDYLRKYLSAGEKWENNIRRTIQEAHFKLLPTGKSCLVTDYEEVHINDKDEIIDKMPLVHCILPSGKYRKTWTWNFDTHKTYHPGCNTMMNVVAIKL